MHTHTLTHTQEGRTWKALYNSSLSCATARLKSSSEEGGSRCSHCADVPTDDDLRSCDSALPEKLRRCRSAELGGESTLPMSSSSPARLESRMVDSGINTPLLRRRRGGDRVGTPHAGPSRALGWYNTRRIPASSCRECPRTLGSATSRNCVHMTRLNAVEAPSLPTPATRFSSTSSPRHCRARQPCGLQARESMVANRSSAVTPAQHLEEVSHIIHRHSVADIATPAQQCEPT